MSRHHDIITMKTRAKYYSLTLGILTGVILKKEGAKALLKIKEGWEIWVLQSELEPA